MFIIISTHNTPCFLSQKNFASCKESNKIIICKKSLLKSIKMINFSYRESRIVLFLENKTFCRWHLITIGKAFLKHYEILCVFITSLEHLKDYVGKSMFLCICETFCVQFYCTHFQAIFSFN